MGQFAAIYISFPEKTVLEVEQFADTIGSKLRKKNKSQVLEK